MAESWDLDLHEQRTRSSAQQVLARWRTLSDCTVTAFEGGGETFAMHKYLLARTSGVLG